LQFFGKSGDRHQQKNVKYKRIDKLDPPQRQIQRIAEKGRNLGDMKQLQDGAPREKKGKRQG
jgi:hypothetical protein